DSRQAVTELGAVMGTPAYMSPEQARGEELTVASDMYSLGIVLQEMFTEEGAYDREATPAVRLVQVAQGASRPVEGVDPDVTRLIEELKNEDPEARPTAEQVVERIDWILDRPRRRRTRRITVAGLVGMAILLGAAVSVSLRLARPKPLLLPGQQGRVLVLPFVNGTGDPANDWVRHGLADLVARTLDGSEGISVVPGTDVSRALAARGLESEAAPSREEILQILHSLGAELALTARLERDDDRFRFRYTTYNVVGSTGARTLAAATLADGANLLARRIAHRLVPDAPAVEVFDRFSDQPFVNRLYAMGVEALHVSGAAGARPYFEVALDRDPDLQWARIRLAQCLEDLGRSTESREAALAALAAARSSHRQGVERAALLQLALQARRKGQYGSARGYYEAALGLARRAQDRAATADALRGLGAVAYFLQDLDLARKRFEEAMAIYRELGDRTGEMYCLGNLSAVADANGDMKTAEALDTRALGIARETGNLQAVADYLNNLGVSARYQGQYERAEGLYRESLKMQRRLGDRLGEANALHNLGDMAKEVGQL
ncbi:MAG TPA: tetratricopeptide repeat protein, partial [Acidobacteria bacterium]|nr:tetratricopeptide repeat protein [Acidobacteriota bacterium]